MNRPTMKDVARVAGVDPSTVSLALRDDPRIRRETRERVKTAAAALGYQVNPLVAAWVRARRGSMPVNRHVPVAYLTHHPTDFDWRRNAHFRAIHGGLRDRLRQFGFHLTAIDLNRYQGRPDQLDRVLVARGVQGLIFGPENHSYEVSGLRWERYCSVAIGYALELPVVHRVTEDHFLGMQMAMRRCHALGARRVGLAFCRNYNRERVERWIAPYLLHVQTQEARIPVLQPEAAPFEEAARAWLREHRPDTVVTDAPERWEGLDVPTVCFAISGDESSGPGVFENNQGIGRSAADALIALLFRNERGLPPTRKNILVEPGEQSTSAGEPIDLQEFFPPEIHTTPEGHTKPTGRA